MFSNPTAVTFIGYLIIMVAVGFFAYYYTRSYSDYILGGRSLGGIVTALSVGASDMSGWLLMGLPGAVFLSGISESAARLLHAPLRGRQKPPAHCGRSRNSSLLHDLLRFGRGGGRAPL